MRHTPLVDSRHFGGLLKLETNQWTGAYKVRGALNALMRQREAGDRRPVVVASAGNHSSGVAWAALNQGLEAIAVIPHTAPRIKVERTRNLGAQVILHGQNYDEAYEEALQIAEERGARFLHAFNDPDVMAGQGTVAVELLEARPDVVVIPVGGGGLAAGMGTLLNDHGIAVVGAQIRGSMPESMDARGPESFHTPPHRCRWHSVRTVGSTTRLICADVLDHIVEVTEAEVRETMAHLALREQIVAEGAGALAVAALRKVHLKGRKVAVVTGGNVDSHVLQGVLKEVLSTTVSRDLRLRIPSGLESGTPA